MATTDPETTEEERKNKFHQALHIIELGKSALLGDRPHKDYVFPNTRAESAAKWLREALEMLEGKAPLLSRDEMIKKCHDTK